jgi:hypothetical protein
LNESERDFVLRMVMASGSLKELAKHYGVSYPTIRARLDRLIEKLAAEAKVPGDPMAGLLGDLVEAGQLASPAARRILDLHRKHLESNKGD